MFTGSHSKLLTTTSDICGYSCYFDLQFPLMACLGISSLRDLLPFWVKRLITTTSDSDQPNTSSSHNTSLQEEIIVLPSPPPSYRFTTPKSAVHGEIDGNGYREYEPPFHRTPPLEPSIISTSEHADRPINGLSQCLTALWFSILIQPLKIFAVKSNAL